MSRRAQARKKKHPLQPDTKYRSTLITILINYIMEQGKKALAEKIVYNALELVEKKHKTDAFEVFNKAISNIRPSIEVTSVRVGGANYQAPAPVTLERGNSLALRWLKNAARARGEHSMIEKLSEEIFEASQGRGAAIKKSEDTRRMAEANRAFAHLSPRRAS